MTKKRFTTNCTQEELDAITAALRSGAYCKTRYKMYDPKARVSRALATIDSPHTAAPLAEQYCFCARGVVCAVLVPDKTAEFLANRYKDNYITDFDFYAFTDAKLGTEASLAIQHLNDDKDVPFDEIANWIEGNLQAS